jgi:hypothetical protein
MMETFNTMLTVLALLFMLATPVVLFVWILNRFWTRWLPWYMTRRESKQVPQSTSSRTGTGTVTPTWTSTETTTYAKKPKKDPPAALKELKTSMIDSQKIVEAGTRVWRTYRSIDGLNWAECDPALTERAACNYGSYIKRCNPKEFVRVNDPEGLIVSYE